MVVVAIIGLLAAIAIPNLVNSGKTAKMNICIANLRYIDAAKQQWALEHRKGDTDIPTGGDLQPYLGRGESGTLPACPSDPGQTFATSYNPQAVTARPVCLIAATIHVLQ